MTTSSLADSKTSSPRTPAPHRRSLLLLAAGATLGLLVAGYGLFTAKGTRLRTVPPEDLALVNGRPILRSDYLTQLRTQYAVPFEQATTEHRRQVLDDMIREELLVQRGLEIDLPSYDPEVRAALATGVEREVSADVLAEKPDEDQLRAWYGAHQDQYVEEGWMRLRDLVAVALPGQSEPARRAADAAVALRGGRALESVIARFGLKDSGRLLASGRAETEAVPEFAARAKLGPALFAAASPLGAGQVSEPTAQSDGVHVIVMLARRAPEPLSFAAAADRVWTDRKAEAEARVDQGNLRYLRERADLQLAPDALQWQARH